MCPCSCSQVCCCQSHSPSDASLAVKTFHVLRETWHVLKIFEPTHSMLLMPLPLLILHPFLLLLLRACVPCVLCRRCCLRLVSTPMRLTCQPAPTSMLVMTPSGTQLRRHSRRPWTQRAGLTAWTREVKSWGLNRVSRVWERVKQAVLGSCFGWLHGRGGPHTALMLQCNATAAATSFT